MFNVLSKCERNQHHIILITRVFRFNVLGLMWISRVLMLSIIHYNKSNHVLEYLQQYVDMIPQNVYYINPRYFQFKMSPYAR